MQSHTPEAMQKRSCSSCGQAILGSELLCPWCGAKQTGEAPPSLSPAPAPVEEEPVILKTAAPRPPVRRPRKEEVYQPGARPVEVSAVAILLVLSSLLTVIGILMGNDILAGQPTMFIAQKEKFFEEAVQTIGSLGLIAAIISLAINSAVAVSLWKMLQWARRVALWAIVAVFCLNFLAKSYVTFTMVSVVQEEAEKQQKERDTLAKQAFGITGAPNIASGDIPAPGQLSARHDRDLNDAADGTDNLNAATDQGTGITPSVSGTTGATRIVRSPPAAEPNPAAAFDLAMKHKGPDMKAEYANGLMMSFAVLTVFAAIFSGILFFMLRMDHVEKAFTDD